MIGTLVEGHPRGFYVTIGNVKSDIGNSKFEIILITSVHVPITSMYQNGVFR